MSCPVVMVRRFLPADIRRAQGPSARSTEPRPGSHSRGPVAFAAHAFDCRFELVSGAEWIAAIRPMASKSFAIHVGEGGDMLDKTANPQHLGQPAQACASSARGISGLVATKVMRERGDDVTVFEKNGDIGGVWETGAILSRRADADAGQQCTPTPTSRCRATIRNGQPAPRSTPISMPTPPRSGLRDSIHFRHEVLNVRPAEGSRRLVGEAARRDGRRDHRELRRRDRRDRPVQRAAAPRPSRRGTRSPQPVGGSSIRPSMSMPRRPKGRDVVVVGLLEVGHRRRDERSRRRRAQRERRPIARRPGRSRTSSAAWSTSRTFSIAAPPRRCSCRGRRASSAVSCAACRRR